MRLKKYAISQDRAQARSRHSHRSQAFMSSTNLSNCHRGIVASVNLCKDLSMVHGPLRLRVSFNIWELQICQAFKSLYFCHCGNYISVSHFSCYRSAFVFPTRPLSFWRRLRFPSVEVVDTVFNTSEGIRGGRQNSTEL